jgi:cullin-associated NEDD8-dissociated protein 1
MGLNDLQQLLIASGPGLLIHDTHVSAKTVDGLLHSLQDSNGEVQNMAIKCLGPFVNKVSADQILCPLIDKISTLKIGDAVDNSIPALALRAIVVSLPHPTPGVARTKAVQEAYSAVSRALIPRLVGYMVIPPARKDLPKPPTGMLQEDMENGTDSNAIDVLTEVARSYGSMLQEAEVNALVKISLEILQHERTTSVLKKKAVVAVAALAASLSDVALSQFTSRLIELLRSPHLTKSKRKLYINLLGSLARAVPTKFGKHLKIIAPFVLTALSQQEIDDDLAALEETEERDPESDDVREAALIALETFLTYCSEDMKTYTQESIEAILRFLKYDPNLAGDDDDDMDDDFAEDDTFGGDEDFEQEVGADDEDDTSWKVRRCAAKVTDVFIETRSKGDLLDNGTLYSQIAPALIARFKEREETVRVEVISALARLVRITGGRTSTAQTAGTAGQASSTAPTSRKRRRGSSSVGSQEYLAARQIREIRLNTPPPGSAKASLESLSPEIVKSVAQLLKGQPLPTKQASISLLKDLSEALQGRLSDYLAQTLEPVIDAIKSSSSGSAAAGSHVASANTYRIEALQFLKAVALAHSSQNLQPYLDKIIPAVVSAARDKYTKVSVAALEAADAYLKTLTAPGSKPTANDKAYIKQIYDAINNRINAPDSDTEVRRLAVRGMGALLGRTSLHQVLGPSDKATGYDLLLSRLKNELTRLSAVRAIETAAILVQDPNDYPQGWVPTVAIELGAQLRKASRVLRGSSLQTLKALSLNASVAQIDSKTIKELLPLLLPILHTGDLHLISSALLVLNAYVQKDPKTVVNKEFLVAFDTLLATTVVAGTTLDNLLILTRSIGEKGVGKDVMAKLLGETSMKANPDTVGKVIANLLVSGGSKTGVKLESFVSEARGKHDDRRKGLALSVLGEAGLRLGPSSPLDPQLFIGFFKEKSDTVPIAAAVALGRAAAGNVSAYLPVILESMQSPSSNQYLLLHSVREILQQEGTESQIIPFAAQLWQNLFAASQADDNRAIAAECIGRLAVLDPATYLPQLQNLLTNSNASTRGMVISALRFTFGDTDESYDSNLEPIIIGMLQTMLSEQDLENRRLAMTTLNSAAQHKPNLIVPHLDDLLPLCMNETQIREELIREVQMGPFKHKVDDGLEIRKVYPTPISPSRPSVTLTALTVRLRNHLLPPRHRLSPPRPPHPVRPPNRRPNRRPRHPRPLHPPPPSSHRPRALRNRLAPRQLRRALQDAARAETQGERGEAGD